MKSFFKFLFIFAGILLLSAFLTPLLYKILPFKFERIFNRLVMIFSFAAILIFIRFRREAFTRYGLGWTQESLPLLTRSFLSAVAVLLLLVGVRYGLGNVRISVSALGPGEWLMKLVKILPAALLIGVIEEFFFRGFVHQALTVKWRWPILPAVAATNLFYSLIHFISGKKMYINSTDPEFLDSLKLILIPFLSLSQWQVIWPGAVGLFIFGGVLSSLVLKTRSLYPAIGLHAGCVFFVKFDGLFVDFLPEHLLWFGTKQMYDGILGWLFLGFLAWAVHRAVKPFALKPLRAFLVTALLSGISLAAWAESEEKVFVKGRGEVDVLYRFSQHLGEAEASLDFGKTRQAEKSEWTGEYFDFTELGTRHRIGLYEGIFEGEARSGIYLHPAQDSKKILKFQNLRLTPQMIVYYGIADPDLAGKQATHFYLRVWIGKHLVKRTRIPYEKGWKQEILDLGVAAFINHPMTVTFDIVSDSESEQFLFFDAALI